MFRRLRVRLTIFCTVVTGLILASMAILSLILAENTLQQRGAATFARDLEPILYELNDSLQQNRMIDHTRLSQIETTAKLMIHIEDSGTPMLFAGSWKRQGREQALPMARELAIEKQGFDIGQVPVDMSVSSHVNFSFSDKERARYSAAAATLPIGDSWIGLIIVRPMTEEQEEVTRLRLGYALLSAAAIILLLVVSWFFTGLMLRPIEENRRRQMEFVAAASHELRSPLAVIAASTTASQNAPPEKARQFQDTVLQECHRMSRLIGDMLLLAGADNRSWSIHRESAEPETLLLDAAEAFEEVAGRKGIRISVTLPETPLPRCDCDRQRIAQVLSVLLDNAVSYTPQGGRIELGARQVRDHLELSVADNGSGIPDAHKEDIFGRFYRLDASRTQKDHYGLGLSIAREIAALHKGSLRVEDAPGGGALFVLTLSIS